MLEELEERVDRLYEYMTDAGASEDDKKETVNFIQDLKNKKNPKQIPSYFIKKRDNDFDLKYDLSTYVFKELMQNECFYGIATQKNCKSIVKKTKGRKILEVVGGVGWFAKGISEAGGEIKSTDNKSWFSDYINVFNIEDIDAVEAVQKYKDDYDILLISWPDMDDTAFNCIKEWGNKKDIIFVGELGGCTADHQFKEHFQPNEIIDYEKPNSFIKDQIFIGKSTYNKPQQRLKIKN